MTASPIFCAVDTPTIDAARSLASRLTGLVGGLKLGLEFFLANGPDGYRALAGQDLPIFLDLKLHDIPNTVAGAVRSVTALNPAFVTIHASGGPAMMKAAAEAARETADKLGAPRPRLLGVTVMTSLDSGDLGAVGQDPDMAAQVDRLAELSRESGLDGIVCSPHEIERLRRRIGEGFTLMVPGIRPRWAAANDQKRVLTPSEAMALGADHLVIGRPITAATDPAEAARRIADELSESHS
ncbi:orotidine-5'-phosphate decarboxylase [Inquilinus sp. CAU 1745]|uniref:orotidine-5'-phosphate decarboxylase n=1 Tax=Inquilinus sp. CAU 1745 TaxID=3140369 RepID=UPI00325B9704